MINHFLPVREHFEILREPDVLKVNVQCLLVHVLVVSVHDLSSHVSLSEEPVKVELLQEID